MSLLVVLGVIAVAQAVFVVLLGLFVVARRERLLQRGRRVRQGRARLNIPLARWLTGAGSLKPVVESLSDLPRDAALAAASELHDVRVPVAQRAALGAAMRGERWTRWALAGATSWRWWRRLDAARAYGIVGTPADAKPLEALLEDEHPAVRLAATEALTAVADPALVRSAVAFYPAEPLAVRLFTSNTLRISWRLAETPLLEFLGDPAAEGHDLAAWLALAESLHLPSLRPTITALVSHADPEVRAAAVRALRRYPHAQSVEAVRSLLDDPQDFVRAASAQALGALRAAESLPQLERGLADGAWWVRFRCALSLALLGEPGRAALRRARQSPDQFARDMAVMTSGLSEGAVLELADV
ncbi:MAG: HEAT repeat domain-containing protein [Gemmatimonadetes bacterium]|nr:HEAT repeat domain-containing protein [Gemmatimonadota bacterium]